VEKAELPERGDAFAVDVEYAAAAAETWSEVCINMK